MDVQLPVLKSSSEEDGTQADYLDEQNIKTGSVNDDYGDVKQVQAAKVIQRTWRRHIVSVNIFSSPKHVSICYHIILYPLQRI